MSKEQAIEAAVFRRLLKHLDDRKDVQNIDLMGYGGFCRNCLSDWYAEAAADAGVDVSKDEARERIYGMPYGEYKKAYQSPATEEQLVLMNESVVKNKAARGEA
ncbi:DUF1244 domain-containing protein [Kordiimonas sp. SCSIO 12603]|uniref:DUF1244 domain-containing protein n=1 Tax=Kordiimonas sp. SCSIO 12603 TaxID=2829596 RepID=UPI002105297D|nr:DUF1244 domain-containing protein [Kordiimonas sp. SCSIO 12603]UTW59648.1 DUF1244 domain-containing protein [Kordiimonas sp. SCSIO 12603]